MTKLSAIARNYAKALFKAAEKGNAVEKIKGDIEKFVTNFSTDFVAELKNPAISKKDSLKIAAELCKKMGFDGIFADFLAVLFENKRASEIFAINSAFQALVKEKDGILEIEVISAQDLDESVIAKVKDFASKQNKGKKIEVIKTIKSHILGGIQVKIGSNLIDASLKSQLESLENQLIKAIG